MRTVGLTVITLAAAIAPLACSSSDSKSPAVAPGGGQSSGGTQTTTGGSAGTTNGGDTSGGTGGDTINGGSGGDVAGSGGSGGATVVNADLTLSALAANQSVGLEWDSIEGADSYRIYVAEGSAATPASAMLEVDGARSTFVHRGLTNGTEYHYVISAVAAGVESPPSADQSATPAGEWVLEELGSGIFEDVSTGQPVARVPLEERQHVLLFAEGYQSADLAIFHDNADHDGDRDNDVDGWIDEVFSIEPYTAFREAFVIWMLPRASNTHFDGGDTAFAVPTVAGSFLGTGSIASNGETAALAWSAIELLPVPPSDFSGGGFGSARTHTAAFLLFDPERGQASVSGRALALRNPGDDSQRISSAFGVGHAHEFTHAFSSLRDEYLEDDNSPPNQWSETSNVVGTSACSELPWAHLLSGTTINAATGELVGAFGRVTHGFHSELVCLLNGTHDNATYYGGNGLLRTNGRMCNFCREMTAYRIYSRSSVVGNDDGGFETWKSDYREAFFARFPFAVPALVPQTNNVSNPDQGDPVYEACTASAAAAASVEQAQHSAGPVVHGCVTID
jgi:hypothetical protein